MHVIPCALSFARDSAGSSSAARIAMIAMTTSSSMRVNAERNVKRDSGCVIRDEGQVRYGLFIAILVLETARRPGVRSRPPARICCDGCFPLRLMRHTDAVELPPRRVD